MKRRIQFKKDTISWEGTFRTRLTRHSFPNSLESRPDRLFLKSEGIPTKKPLTIHLGEDQKSSTPKQNSDVLIFLYLLTTFFLRHGRNIVSLSRSRPESWTVDTPTTQFSSTHEPIEDLEGYVTFTKRWHKERTWEDISIHLYQKMRIWPLISTPHRTVRIRETQRFMSVLKSWIQPFIKNT